MTDVVFEIESSTEGSTVKVDGKDIASDLKSVDISADRLGLKVTLNYVCADVSVAGDESTEIVHRCPFGGRE